MKGRNAADGGIGRSAIQVADHRHRRLLREPPYGPRCRSPAHKRNERAAFHSITSSALTRMVFGTARPSAFALFRFMTNSNLVGCNTGRLAGFSPLRTLPV